MNKNEALQMLKAMYNDIVIGLDVTKIPIYFKEEYVQVTDGTKTNREELVQHITALKKIVRNITISPFYDILFDKPLQTMTLRYVVEVTKKDGSQGQIELIAIYELADNKIFRCNEISSPLHQAEDFREIAKVMNAT